MILVKQYPPIGEMTCTKQPRTIEHRKIAANQSGTISVYSQINRLGFIIRTRHFTTFYKYSYFFLFHSWILTRNGKILDSNKAEKNSNI